MYLPRLIAHRGASGQAPENTLEAFELAAKQGADWVELDVQLTRDLVPIVCHDKGLLRLAHVDTPVCELTYDQIKHLEVGSWFDQYFTGIQIPTLEETLQSLEQLNLKVNIELKPNHHTGHLLAGKVINVLDKSNFSNGRGLLLSSSHAQILQQFAALTPDRTIAQGLIFKRWNPNWLAIAQHLKHLISIHLDQSLLTCSRINEIHQAGYQVLAFTVNDYHQAQLFDSWEVDGFFSDQIPQLASN